MTYQVHKQGKWFWVRWWFAGKWQGTLLCQTVQEAERIMTETRIELER